MELTDDQLAEIEVFGANFFNPNQIAIVLGVDPDELTDELTDNETLGYKSYQRGRLMTTLEIRKSIITLAKQGSGPAQTLAMRMIENSDE